MGFTHFVIDTDTCEECRLCIPVCPVQAIELKPKLDFPKEEAPMVAVEPSKK
jgi:NAD-dependent dihydropyrimidine dehydrogenase PreA subunit